MTLTAKPTGTAVLSSWSSNSGCSGTPTTCDVTVTGDLTVTVTFVDTYAVSLTVTGAGSIGISPDPIAPADNSCSSACTVTFPAGTSVTFTQTAATGYAFDSWSGCSAAGQTCTVNAAAKITATFRQNPPATTTSPATSSLLLVPTPAAGPAPLAVSFAIDAKLSVPIQHWQLLFGDGSVAQADGAPPGTLRHTYARTASYQAVLFVYRSPPFTPATTPFRVAANVDAGTSPTPVLSFVATPRSGPLPLAVSFRTELALGAAPTGYTIAWGDGTSRTGSGTPPHFTGHTFTQKADNNVLLLVSASGGRRFAAVTQVTSGSGGGGGGGGSTTTTSGGSSPPATGTTTGTVLVNGAPFTGGTLPRGAIVDVTHGNILLSSGGGKVHLYGAGVSSQFKLLRGTSNGKPTVVVQLSGGDFSVCGTRKGTRRVADALAPRPKTTTVRQIWGNGKGHFTTRGRYSAATVRGTYWLTRDRCDGTLITVRQGVVAVFSNKTGKTVLVRAGHRLLVRP